MNTNTYTEVKNSLVLFELSDKLLFLINLFKDNRFPNILMLTGKKGIGKSTLINHFVTYMFDSKNYDLKNNIINNKSHFYKQYSNNIFPDIIYLDGSNYKNVKVDDIRNLKKAIFKTSLSSKFRFIILDDIELFNTSSLNALLKVIEEPPQNNYFILINNKTKPVLQTIHSRSIEISISLTNNMRENIIKTLIKNNNLQMLIDHKISDLTPGNFLLFNDICTQNKIDINGDYSKIIENLLMIYKKNKDMNIINFILFLTEFYFHKLSSSKNVNHDNIYDKKNYIINNINKFVTYNLNQNSLINAINNKLTNG